MKSNELSRVSGLSLMEIMIALVIVAIIGGVAYPRLQKMVTRSKQTEAKTLLQAVYVSQDLYKTANQKYASRLEDLDIEIPSGSRYQYSLASVAESGTFAATALANIDGDPAVDEWRIDQSNQLTNIVNDVLE